MVHLATRVDVDPDRWLGKECRTPGRSAEDKYINEMLDNYRNVIKNKYNELFFPRRSDYGHAPEEHPYLPQR